jgi:hypothetical protein
LKIGATVSVLEKGSILTEGQSEYISLEIVIAKNNITTLFIDGLSMAYGTEIFSQQHRIFLKEK